MEKIKVNMNPNPLDVQTIHASQNDGEARQWEFELHNNGELIDTSEVTEQMVFKSYKGGTEQILPENGAVPVTAPFVGDIKYPDATRADQEFLYRQSPTEEDGLAKITDIKGNTLVWNQLAKELNATNWPAESATVSYSDGICTLTPTGFNGRISADVDIIVNHKYLMLGDFTNVDNQPVYFYIGAIGSYSAGIRIPQTSVLTRQSKIYTATETGKIYVRNNSNTGVVTIKNLMLIDLTQMGLDITDPSEFTSLFSLPYYDFNAGTLLSFNGTGLKTVGFNQWDGNSENGKWINDYSTGAVSTAGSDYNVTDFIHVFPNTTYYHTTTGSRRIMFYDGNKNPIPMTSWEYPDTAGMIISPPNAHYIRFTITNSYLNNFCFNISDQLKDGTVESYISSTLSLPISTYFPNGMNGHGDTYDELTPIVATKRFEKDSLGDLTWTRRTTNIFSANLPSEFDASKDISCFMSNRLPTVFVSGYTLAEDGYISIYKTTTVTSSTTLYLNMASQSIDTVANLQTWLSNNPTELVYPLATPTETPITTASLVTENAEIPLSNEDGVLIGKCTEQLSAEPGFHDAKIKLADGEGECYSNKIQLHVERSPQ